MGASRSEERVGYHLTRAARALKIGLDRALRDLGLNTPQYAILVTLEEEPGRWGASLARDMLVSPQAMNGLVASLESARLIERKPHPEHNRVLRAYLTEEGRELVTKAHKVAEAAEGVVFGELDEDEKLWLIGRLRSFTEASLRLAEGAS